MLTIWLIGFIVHLLLGIVSNLNNKKYTTGVITASILIASALWPISLLWWGVESTLKLFRG